jgi:hypothetical protein
MLRKGGRRDYEVSCRLTNSGVQAGMGAGVGCGTIPASSIGKARESSSRLAIAEAKEVGPTVPLDHKDDDQPHSPLPSDSPALLRGLSVQGRIRMEFINESRGAEICWVLLRKFGLEHHWTSWGPAPEAWRELERGAPELSAESRIFFLVVWELWGEMTELTPSSLTHLAAPRRRLLDSLLAAAARGNPGIDRWLAAHRSEETGDRPAQNTEPAILKACAARQ